MNINKNAKKNKILKINNIIQKYKIIRNNNIKLYNNNIPLNIYQTWYTKNLPPKMLEAVNFLKEKNPEFCHFLFDDNDCREFIKNNFDNDVLNTFDKLKPGAFKADLWRYCVLYINGGVYLDIKFIPVNNFKLIHLINENRFVTDETEIISEYNNIPNIGIYNAFMISNKRNPVLLNAINKIVMNAREEYYGITPIDVTGPIMFGKFFTKEYMENNILKKKHLVENNVHGRSLIVLNKTIIFIEYEKYREEQHKSPSTYYQTLWHNKDIYNM